jgi:hypothetical protein
MKQAIKKARLLRFRLLMVKMGMLEEQMHGDNVEGAVDGGVDGTSIFLEKDTAEVV